MRERERERERVKIWQCVWNTSFCARVCVWEREKERERERERERVRECARERAFACVREPRWDGLSHLFVALYAKLRVKDRESTDTRWSVPFYSAPLTDFLSEIICVAIEREERKQRNEPPSDRGKPLLETSGYTLCLSLNNLSIYHLSISGVYIIFTISLHR